MTEPARGQTVRIVLSDGRVGHFTGKVLVESEDDLKVTGVTFYAPRELPPGCAWEEIEEPK